MLGPVGYLFLKSLYYKLEIIKTHQSNWSNPLVSILSLTVFVPHLRWYDSQSRKHLVFSPLHKKFVDSCSVPFRAPELLGDSRTQEVLIFADILSEVLLLFP